MHILVLEDDPAIADLLRRALKEDGHTVALAATIAAARDMLGGVELMLVDRMLPDGDGLDLLRQLRASGDRRPALCITARDRVEERVDGLLGGADDYLTKPFAMAEMLARIKALARRAEKPHVLVVGDLRVDLAANRFWRGEIELELTPQEAKLLKVFAENTGKVLSRPKILELAWGLKRDPGTNIVDVYVGYLRHKLDDGRPKPLLRTVRGIGWVLEDPG